MREALLNKRVNTFVSALLLPPWSQDLLTYVDSPIFLRQSLLSNHLCAVFSLPWDGKTLLLR